MVIVYLITWYWMVINSVTLSETIPAVPDTTVKLTCNKRPSTLLVWKHVDNNRIIAESGVVVDNSKYKVIKQAGNEQLVIQSVSLIDDGEYICFYRPLANDAQSHYLNILIRPSSIETNGPTYALSEGTKHTLTCQVSAAKPLPVVTWILTEFNGSQTEFLGSTTDQILPNKLGNRQSRLDVTLTREMYRAVFICQASISFFYSMDSIIGLDVLLMPLTPEVSSSALSYDPGALSSVLCKVRSARPAATIIWSIDGEQIQGISTESMLLPDGTFTSTSTLLMTAPTWEEDALVTCTAVNQAVLDSGLPPPSKNTTLKMNFAPTIELNFTHDTVQEGSNAMLYCVVSSRPLPKDSQITWTKETAVVSGGRYTTGNASFPFLVIRNVKREDSGRYRCHVSNQLGVVLGEPITLHVRYKPVCWSEQQTKYAAEVGSSITIECIVDSFPNDVKFDWYYHNSKTNMYIISEDGLPDSSQPFLSHSFLNVTVSHITDYGLAVCNASNSIGLMTQSCFIHIVPPGPSEAPTNCSIQTVTNHLMTVLCKAGFDGGFPQIFLLLLSDNGGPFFSISTQDDPEFRLTDLHSDTTYRMRICSTNSGYPANSNCSSVLTARTQKDLILPGSDNDRMNIIVIGTSATAAVCVPAIVILLVLTVKFWKAYKHGQTKDSSGRVVVARSTGSLVMENSSKASRIEDVQETCSNKEKQLMALVDNIDWREGQNITRYPNCENLHNLSAGALRNKTCKLIVNSMPNLTPGHMTCSRNQFSLEARDIVRDGLYNHGFDNTDDDDQSSTQSIQHMLGPWTDSYSDATSDLDSVDTKSEDVCKLTPINPVDKPLRDDHLFDGMIRSGSYNLAIASNEEINSKVNNIRNSSRSQTFSHSNSNRYQGFTPVYF